MKKGLLLGALLGLVFSLFLIISVNAGIYFSNPESYYNLGDVIEIEASIDPVLEGFLKVDLVCEGGTVNVFNGVLNEEGKASIKFPLTFSYIKENSGKCYFNGHYFGLNARSREFEISKALEVRLDIDSLVAKPGEEIVVSGTAKRLNKQGIDGEVEISIPLLKLKNDIEEASESDSNQAGSESSETEKNISANGVFYGKASEGKFSVTLKLGKNTPAGDYRIDVKAYEKDSLGKITSEGLAMANLKILQIPSSIDIALSTQTINPGQVFEFKPRLLDQAGGLIQKEISVVIKNEKSSRISEQIFKSGETFSYNIPANLTSGYYSLEVSADDIISTKSFYVNEKAIAFFEIRNNTLTVTNVGNIPYKKDIQVDMNGKPFVKKVSLGLGEVQKFKLTGDGSYDVKVSDGETESFQGVSLTGNAVNVEAVRTGLVALNTPIVWLFFLIVLGAGILFLFRNILKKKSFAYPFKEKILEKIKRKKQESPASETETKKITEMPVLIKKHTGEAEPVLVLKGKKDRVAVLGIKIKNKLTKNSGQELEKIIKMMQEKKGAVYEKEDSLISVFSPLMTRTFKNELMAAKTAEMVKETLEAYNKKFADKIEFGIGINSGEVVDKIEGGKLKFTALGNLVSGVKRIAESSDGKILLTKEAYERGGNDIKATRRGDVYEIKNIIDSEKNKAFLDSFLKRIGNEGKKGSLGL